MHISTLSQQNRRKQEVLDGKGGLVMSNFIFKNNFELKKYPPNRPILLGFGGIFQNRLVLTDLNRVLYAKGFKCNA